MLHNTWSELRRKVNNRLASAAPTAGMLEHLPKWFNLVPMVTQWLWLSAKYGSISLPSCTNPEITTGGMVGEGKLEYFNIMGPVARQYAALTTGLSVHGRQSLNDALSSMREHGLAFPIIAKPDIGWCGFGVRRIDDGAALESYLSDFPNGETVVLQEYLPWDHEAGIFYARKPGEGRGWIIGILLRSCPSVTGDGKKTIAQLMAQNPRLARLGRDGLHVCTHDPNDIPAAGEKHRLATICSTRVGGLYEDGTRHATPALAARMDCIVSTMGSFYMGRFDVRFKSFDDLRRGENFRIMEVNGAGSEAVHAWDPRYTLRQAYAIVFAKQRLLFEIADMMRKRGHRPCSLRTLAWHYFRQQNLIRRYPPSN